MDDRHYIPFFVLVIAQDCLAFLLSAKSMLQAYRGGRSELGRVLLRDTAMWLGICLAASIANVVRAR